MMGLYRRNAVAIIAVLAMLGFSAMLLAATKPLPVADPLHVRNVPVLKTDGNIYYLEMESNLNILFCQELSANEYVRNLKCAADVDGHLTIGDLEIKLTEASLYEFEEGTSNTKSN